MKRYFFMSIVAAMTVVGCANDPVGVGKDGDNSFAEKEVIPREDSTRRFSHDTASWERRLSELPESGRAAEETWPETYSPHYRDGINYQWRGADTYPPSALYDMAFNNWEPPDDYFELRRYERDDEEDDFDRAFYDDPQYLGPLARWVHHNYGFARDIDGTDANGDGKDVDTGTWWGMCDMWTAATAHELPVRRAVTYNGVEFAISDIQQLMVQAYKGYRAVGLGLRCDEGHGNVVLEERNGENYAAEVRRDEYGRPVDDGECKGVNPGAFHLTMANLLGRFEQSFNYDRTFDDQVWNQNVAEFEVNEMREVTATEANELLGRTDAGDAYAYNDDAVQFFEVKATTKYLTESDETRTVLDAEDYLRDKRHHYILEIDANGEIFGGEWIRTSQWARKEGGALDFLWRSYRKEGDDVPNLSIDNIRMLVEMSQTPEPTASDDLFEGSVSPGAAIPDNNTTGISSTINLSGTGNVASAVTVSVDIEHTFSGDIEVQLTHNGTTKLVRGRLGGSTPDVKDTFIVDGFVGESVAGEWTLTVRDLANLDTGTLTSWEIKVPGGEGRDSGNDQETINFPGNVAIPDNDPSGVDTQIELSGVTSFTSLIVAYNIEHTYRSDLQLKLIHGPSGDEFVIQGAIDSDSSDNLIGTFDVPFMGDANGTWILRASDHASQDEGTITSASMTVVY